MVKKLYVVVRTDMNSMGSGRTAAQVGHACNQFVFDKEKTSSNKLDYSYKQWVNQTPYGFGTAIVLDGGNLDNFYHLYETLTDHAYFKGIVIDPEYMIKDGDAYHLLKNVPTCFYVLPLEADDCPELSHLQLYGN